MKAYDYGNRPTEIFKNASNAIPKTFIQFRRIIKVKNNERTALVSFIHPKFFTKGYVRYYD